MERQRRGIRRRRRRTHILSAELAKLLLRTSVSSHQVRGGVDEGENEDDEDANEERNDDADDFLWDKNNLSEVSDEEDDVSAEEVVNITNDGIALIFTSSLSLTLTVA